MNSFRRFIPARVSSGLERAARRLGRPFGLAIVYHRIGDPLGDVEREIVPALGTQLFEAQLIYLAESFRVVPASELLPAVQAWRRGERYPVAVTFDDDLASHRQVAMPILQHVGVPATFFLSGASLVEPYAFWWERLQLAFDCGLLDIGSLIPPPASEPARRRSAESIHELARRIEELQPADRAAVAAALEARVGPDPPESGMRTGDIAALVAAGFEIGFHTLRHDRLPPLDEAALMRAMTDGRSEVERAVGGPVTVISYPHGRADERVAAAARDAGYSYGFTTRHQPIRTIADPLLLGRFSPSYHSMREFAFVLSRAVGARIRG